MNKNYLKGDTCFYIIKVAKNVLKSAWAENIKSGGPALVKNVITGERVGSSTTDLKINCLRN
jgi:hypothetical protein